LYDPKHIGVKEFYVILMCSLINMCMSWLLLTLNKLLLLLLLLYSFLQINNNSVGVGILLNLAAGCYYTPPFQYCFKKDEKQSYPSVVWY